MRGRFPVSELLRLVGVLPPAIATHGSTDCAFNDTTSGCRRYAATTAPRSAIPSRRVWTVMDLPDAGVGASARDSPRRCKRCSLPGCALPLQRRHTRRSCQQPSTARDLSMGQRAHLDCWCDGRRTREHSHRSWPCGPGVCGSAGLTAATEAWVSWGYVIAVLTYVINIPFTYFVEGVIGPGWKNSTRWVRRVVIAFAVAAILIDLVWGKPEAATVANSWLVLILVSIALGHGLYASRIARVQTT